MYVNAYLYRTLICFEVGLVVFVECLIFYRTKCYSATRLTVATQQNFFTS